MSRYERTGKRDLFFSGWHRFLPDHCTMIDLDVVEYCQRCRETIALIETCHHFVEFKNTTVTARLAAAAGRPAYLLQYEADLRIPGAIYTITRAWLTRVWPEPKTLLGEFSNKRLSAWFVELHRRHDVDCEVSQRLPIKAAPVGVKGWPPA